MTFLLDVNVLIALFDDRHLFHTSAQAWFDQVADRRWATCPITENAVLRIMAHPRYPNAVGAPSMIARAFRNNMAMPGHEFLPDDLSLLTSDVIDSSKLLRSGQITDTYLLALAVTHGKMFATFDRRLSPDAVIGGAAALHFIPVLDPTDQ